jgi:hypothetical protein
VRGGWCSFVFSFDLAPSSFSPTGPHRHGLVLASRLPLVTHDPERFPVPWQERVLSPTIHVHGASVEIRTTHVKKEKPVLAGLQLTPAAPLDEHPALTPHCSLPRTRKTQAGARSVLRSDPGAGRRFHLAPRSRLASGSATAESRRSRRAGAGRMIAFPAPERRTHRRGCLRNATHGITAARPGDDRVRVGGANVAVSRTRRGSASGAVSRR